MKDPVRANEERIETLEFWLKELHDRLQRLIGGEANAAWLQRCAADERVFEERLTALKQVIASLDQLAAFPETGARAK